MKKISFSRRVFLVFDYFVLISGALLCLLPMIHVLALSFSSNVAASTGKVVFWPVDFMLNSYEYVANKPEFFKSILVSFERVALGVPLSMLLTILVAYPMSKGPKELSFRKAYTVFYMITILFGGGLIPWYLTIKTVGLIDSIFALVIPGSVSVFNIIVLLNFFRGLPKEIEEAAFIDGASHWRTLWQIYVPLSVPSLATLILFTAVGQWNSWFDGIVLMNSAEHYPLQSYLQTLVVQRNLLEVSFDELMEIAKISDRTTKAAQIFLGALPILLLYPFLQKYFMHGLVLGSVKG